MVQAMNAIDCLVHAQVATDAFGAVVCEANAWGRPVIASHLDGIPEALAIGNYGQLVRPGSVEELARALERWANQPPLGQNARADLHGRVAAQFSLPAAAGRMLELYRSLWKKRPDAA